MNVAVGKVVGKVGQRGWAQVHDYTPEDEDRASLKGRLVAVVSVKTFEEVEQVEMVKTGREILSRLHELYFGEETLGAMEALKRSVTNIAAEFDGVDLACVVILGNIVYVVCQDGAGAWVEYEGKSGWLVTPGAGAGKLSVFSGRVREEMIIVFGNDEFWRELPVGVLKSAMEIAREDMESGVEMLAAVQRGQESEGGEGGVMMRVVPGGEEPGVEKLEEREEEVTITNEAVATEPQTTKSKRWEEMRGKVEGFWSKLGWRIYVRRGDREQQKKKMMYIGLGFVVILAVMVGVGQVVFNKRSAQQLEQTDKSESIVSGFKEAGDLAELNPARSRQLLTEIKSQLATLTQKEKSQKVLEVEREWQGVWDRAVGIVNAEQTELLDLKLVREDMVGVKMAWNSGKLEILDAGAGRVVEVDPKTGANKILAGGEAIKGEELIAGYPGKVVLWGEKGVIEIGDPQPKIKTDDDWEEIVDIEMWGGNIYLLDRGAGEVWRYTAKTGGYGNKAAWVTNGEVRDEIKQSGSMTIDGNIWVVYPGGIVKFVRGAREVLDVSTIDKPWGDGATIFTNEEAENLYVLDPGNKRIVVLKKDGQYVKQLVGGDWDKVMDFVVDEKSGMIFVLSGSKVGSVKL